MAVNPRIRHAVAIHVFLIAVIVLNALGPTTAFAMSFTNGNDADPALAPILGASGLKGSYIKHSALFPISVMNLQVGTPIASPTETSTPRPSMTSTIAGSTSTLIEATSTPSPTIESTPTFSSTSTQTPNIPVATPLLSLDFSATPEQANVGDQITFQVEIVNIGESAAAGLRFSNMLPEGFEFVPGEDRRFTFDPQTRELTWTADQGMTLLPGENIVLQYMVVVAASNLEDVQIIDTASVGADAMIEPLPIETELTLLTTGSSLSQIDSSGGRVTGLDGQVELNFPENSIDTSEMVSIRDLGQNTPPPAEGETWLLFELGVRVPSSSETPTPDTGSEPQENDRIITLETREIQFNEPVELTVSMDGLADLATLGADVAPFLVTLDEASNTWVRMPLKSADREANTIKAELTHFSTWGVGIGPSFPTNGAGVLLFDSAYPALFTGRSKYSIPIWTPPGRNGMQPDLTLSYSSGSVDGLLGDIQAPWVGMGWNIDSVEIARKITNGGCNPCGGGSYGYEDKFLLLFNGTGYELVRDLNTTNRYRTKDETFMYIQRHNDVMGAPSTANSTGEWWEVVEKDGTRWRLGWGTNSEQLAAMNGYPGEASGAWATLGYAGHATNVVASRWRVDQVTDVYGNTMTFTYYEVPRIVAGTTANYDRASYIDTISYTGHTSGTPTAGYSVKFERVSRGTSDVPATQTDWDNWESDLLDRVEIKYGSTIVRTYDLGYTVVPHTDGSPSVTWQTTTLTSVAISGSTTIAPVVSTSAPTVTFAYVEKDNRAANGSSSNEWAYPRLLTINNGWGGLSTYTYENDGRPYTSWYNWRVKQLDIADGVNASPMKTTFSYITPCYKIDPYGWCTGDNTGELTGYAQTTATKFAFDGTTIVGKIIHKFSTDPGYEGVEYETQYQDASGTTFRKTLTSYSIFNVYGLPPFPFSAFRYVQQVDEYLLNGGTLALVSRIGYTCDGSTGNTTGRYDYASNDLYSSWCKT